MNKIQLLSPAGDIERAKYAISYGADCIYLGGEKFSARSSATNFSIAELEEITEYASLRNVEVLLAINTLIKENELEELKKYLQDISHIGLHAIIVQDLGVAKIIIDNLPNVKLHASTQLTAHSLEDVHFLQNFGFSRVVLSREVSLDEIKYIKQHCDIEIEVFCHGANCVSFSGQCLMSSLSGGRSGNRGKCAQPCRLTYDLIDPKNNIVKQGYLLSPKDTFSIEEVPELIESGVSTLKIEGRMKNKTYVSSVTNAYRNKIDDYYGNKIFDSTLLTEINQVFNRGGSLQQMYLNNYSSPDMMSINTPKSSGTYLGDVVSYKNGVAKIKTFIDLNNADGIEIWTNKNSPNVGTNINKPSISGDIIDIKIKGNITPGDKVFKSYDKKLDNKYKNYKDTKKTHVSVDVTYTLGSKAILSTVYKDEFIQVEGNVVELVQNKPTTKDTILEKLNKTGASTFTFNFNNVTVDDDIFVPISEINNLRRSLIEQLEQVNKSKLYNKSATIDLPTYENKKSDNLTVTVEVTTREQLEVALTKNVDKILMNTEHLNDIKDIDLINNSNKPNLFIKLPRITGKKDINILNNILYVANEYDVSGFVVCTLGQISTIKKITDKPIYLDYSFNIFNSVAANILLEQASGVCLSPELTLQEINSLSVDKNNCEIIGYGSLPNMITRQCPVGLYVADKGNSSFCKLQGHSSIYKLNNYKVLCNCKYCYATILNDKCINSLYNNYVDKIKSTGVKNIRLIFTTEDKNKTSIVIDEYIKATIDETYSDLKELIDTYDYLGHLSKNVL